MKQEDQYDNAGEFFSPMHKLTLREPPEAEVLAMRDLEGMARAAVRATANFEIILQRRNVRRCELDSLNVQREIPC